jgi:hypothetical protein
VFDPLNERTRTPARFAPSLPRGITVCLNRSSERTHLRLQLQGRGRTKQRRATDVPRGRKCRFILLSSGEGKCDDTREFPRCWRGPSLSALHGFDSESANGCGSRVAFSHVLKAFRRVSLHRGGPSSSDGKDQCLEIVMPVALPCISGMGRFPSWARSSGNNVLLEEGSQ